MIIGVDLGNYAVKTSTKVNFMSKVTQEENFSCEDRIIFNGVPYFIGHGEFSTEWVKSRKENTLLLLFTALYKSTKESVNQVVVGLPAQQFKKDRYDLKQLIENNRCAEINNKQFVIADIEVAPEGASAFYNIPYNVQKDVGSKQLVIIDIGGRTTDIIVLKNKKIVDVKTVPVGALNVYQSVVDYINTKYTQSFLLEDGETVLNEGLFLDGENKDISFVVPILKKHFNSIYKEVQLKVNLDVGYVFLTGGGSSMFKKAFKNRLKNLITSDDPCFDNAIGFEKVGEQLWQEK